MISTKQYHRLTIVLAIPLLLLGWWLVKNEKIIPLHNFIYCEESDSEINCNSRIVTNRESRDALYGNAAVQLWGARLEGGFSHSVIDIEASTVYSGEGVPPVSSGVKKHLSLPPVSIQGEVFAFCIIRQYVGDGKLWAYKCTGSDEDGFYFENDKVNQKFLNAEILIREITKKNETLNTWGTIFTASVPLIAYFLMSIALLVLSKVIRYVIYGRAKNKVSAE